MNSKSLVKASKTKNFPYKNERAQYDKNLMLINSEIVIMRMQNDSKLKIYSVFSNLSSELSLVPLDEEETFQIIDMKFLSDDDQIKLGISNSNQHKNMLAVIDNKNRLFIIEIVMNYEGELHCFIFAEMPYQENGASLQIAWAGQHLLILKEGSQVIDRDLNLKNRTVFQKKQYQLSESLGCKKMAVQNYSKINLLRFFCISGDGKKMYSCSNESSKSIIVSELQIQENDEILEIFISAFEDVIVLTRQGHLFQIHYESLQVLSQSKFKLEEDEIIIEAHHDNTLTSLFSLSTRNQIHQIFLDKVSPNQIFKSRGIFRFHSKNTLFTFRVLTAPLFLESCIQTKNSHSSKTIQTAFQELKPSPDNVKFFIYSLLQQASENMKIFSLSLATHEVLINSSSSSQLEFPIVNSLKIQEEVPSSNTAISKEDKESRQTSDKKKLKYSQNSINGNEEQIKLKGRVITIPVNPYEAFLSALLLEQEIQIKPTSISSELNSNQQIQQQQVIPLEDAIQPSQILEQQQQYKIPSEQYSQIQQSKQQQEVKSEGGVTQKRKKKNKMSVQEDNPQEQEEEERKKDNQNPLIFEGVRESKIQTIFQKNLENITKTLDSYFETKFNKIDAVVTSKIEKIRKEEDVLNLVDKCTSTQREKTEAFLREELDSQYQKNVEPSIRSYLVEMFSQMTKTFEKGQKYYNDKIQSEKEKCKIQNENSDEVLGLVKKITTPFSESAITHKKILTELSSQSNERKLKMEQFEKQLSLLASRQDQILSKLSPLQKASTQQESDIDIKGQQTKRKAVLQQQEDEEDNVINHNISPQKMQRLMKQQKY